MRRLVLLALTLACLVEPAAALAHPRGNTTVNRYSRVELSGDRVYVLCDGGREEQRPLGASLRIS